MIKLSCAWPVCRQQYNAEATSPGDRVTGNTHSRGWQVKGRGSYEASHSFTEDGFVLIHIDL